MNPFPDKKYKIIYADPPWDYHTAWYRKDSDTAGIWGLARDHYQCMKLEDIKNLPIKDIADGDCFLFLWATFPQMQEALDVIKSWGFEYKTVAFVWIKTNKNNAVNKMNMGWYTRANAEPLLIARRGKIKVMKHDIKQIHMSTQTDHSEKPNYFRNKIVELVGDLPRIELFARSKIHGWDVWGNDSRLQDLPLESFSRLH